MTTESASSPRSFWPMGRVLTVVLGLGFLGLMADIRVEHVEVVHEDSIGWLPIIYSGLMALGCIITAFKWNKISRNLMLVFFALGFIVGGFGFYEHNRGHMAHVITSSAEAWTNPEMKHPDSPPQSAPMAFAGMSLIGIIACLKRFN